MKRFLLIIILLVNCPLLCAESPDSASVKLPHYVHGVYRLPYETQKGMKIWIVDGLIIRREIYGEFLYGGNPAPYIFVPKNEIWIDHAISAEEFEYTLVHEINEYNLMMMKGMGYSEAHDSSLTVEKKMRTNDAALAQKHELAIHKVSPKDCYGLKQIEELPDSISLSGIYRQRFSSVNGIDVWIVDGSKIRREIFPDFGFSGNDLAYKFIPNNEIWIDGQISCEETEISISSELEERTLMTEGLSYDEAYSRVVKRIQELRYNLHKTSLKHTPLKVPLKLTREHVNER